MDFAGEWGSRYGYSGGESTHTLRFERVGDKIVGTSFPNEEESELRLDLQLDGNILSGPWREKTSPTGDYQGQEFHGVIQLIVNAEGTKAEGLWLGFNRDKTKINSGPWSLERQ